MLISGILSNMVSFGWQIQKYICTILCQKLTVKKRLSLYEKQKSRFVSEKTSLFRSFYFQSLKLQTDYCFLSWKVLIIFRCVIWRKGRSGERSVVTGTGRGRRIRHGFVELLWNRTDIERLSWSWNWWKYMVSLSMWSHQGCPYCEQ